MKKRFLAWLMIFPFFFAGPASAQNKVYKPLSLVFNDQIYKLDFKVNPDLISKTPRYFWKINNQKVPLDLNQEILAQDDLIQVETVFEEEISRDYLKKLFDEMFNIGDETNSFVKISRDKTGKIMFSGVPHSGYDIKFEKFYKLVNDGFKKRVKYIRIPAKKKFSRVIVEDKELQKRGIKEVIAIGESNFAGSSWARRKNISVAAGLYNGLIIPRGKIFSFNEVLQDVSEARGFVRELVIKGNKTEKEYGGGVCQVSTTVFRAAFLGGLDIIKRRSHSYAVPYYKPHGLDATIYLGVQDFKFKNDTPGDILIQTVVNSEKNELKFIFYGTRDNREVEIEGPFISSYRRAPEPIIEKTDQLPPGEKYLQSYAHDGFFTRWRRHIKLANGENKEELLNSNYRPWPARILLGVPPEELE